MLIEQLLFENKKGWKAVNNNNLSLKAQLVLVFGDRELLKQDEHFQHIRSIYINAEIVGCSTSGSICGDEISTGTIICTAIYFEKTHIKVVNQTIDKMENSFDLGKKLINQLEKENLKHVLVLSEGLTINGSQLTYGLNTIYGNEISITGGLAGDDANFSETVLLNNSIGKKNQLIAIGFYGEHIKIGYGSMGGWDSFGVDRLVTRSKANILYELDGQPALALYKKYLGEYAANLPSSALLFPLSFISSKTKTPIVRTILSINEADGSMTFAGDIPEGEYVRLMKASSEKLFEGAADAAEMAITTLQQRNPDLAILISCVGRRLVLKQRVEQELESVREVIGKETVYSGFYSYGEICPLKAFDLNCELLNQTMTITLFKEV